MTDEAAQPEPVLAALLDLLNDDLGHAAEALVRADTPYARRTYIRTLLTVVEGFVALIKDESLAWESIQPGTYSAAELSLLREEQYELDGNARPVVRQRSMSPAANLRFALEAHGRGFDPTYRLDVSDVGWMAFKETIAVRNRLTHPKSLGDLDVSDADMSTALRAREWVEVAVVATLLHVNQHLSARSPEESEDGEAAT